MTIIIIIRAFLCYLTFICHKLGTICPELFKYEYLQGSDHRPHGWRRRCRSGREDCVRSWRRSALQVPRGHEPALFVNNGRLQKIGGGEVAQWCFGWLQHHGDEAGHVGGGGPAEGVRLWHHLFQKIGGVWCRQQVDQERQHFWEGVALCPLLPRQSLVFDCRCQAWWSCKQWDFNCSAGQVIFAKSLPNSLHSPKQQGIPAERCSATDCVLPWTGVAG